MCKICTHLFCIKFAFSETIADVFANNRAVTTKQLCHLLLCQPHGLTFQPHFEAYGVIGLIKDNLAFGIGRNRQLVRIACRLIMLMYLYAILHHYKYKCLRKTYAPCHHCKEREDTHIYEFYIRHIRI